MYVMYAYASYACFCIDSMLYVRLGSETLSLSRKTEYVNGIVVSLRW